MAEETIIIKGGSVTVELGASLIAEGSEALDTESPPAAPIKKTYSCNKSIKKVLIENPKGNVIQQLEDSNGLLCIVTVVYE